MAHHNTLGITGKFHDKSKDFRQIVILTSDCLVVHMYLNEMMPFFEKAGIKPVIFMTPDTKSPRGAIPSLKQFSFLEEGILADVIYPALEANEGKIQRITPTFNQLMRAHQCKPITVDSIKDPAIAKALNAPGHMGTISMYQDNIFKPDMIAAVKEKGFFWNLHPAVLPQNQGLYLIFWNLLKGKTEHGSSLHEVEEGIDKGAIISVDKGPLNKNKSVVEQYFDFTKGGAHLVTDALATYMQKGKVDFLPLSENKDGAYYTFPTEQDIAEGWEKGVRMWGTAKEMADTYTRIFGNDNLLRPKIYEAIRKYERQNLEERPVAAVKAPVNNNRQSFPVAPLYRSAQCYN